MFAAAGGQVSFQNFDEQRGAGELRMDARPDPAALAEALRIGFEQLALQQIYLDLDPAEMGALRVYEETGFRQGSAGEQNVVRLRLNEQQWRAASGRGPRIVLMQPQFLPWLGYLELIHRADVFVFLDDFQFVRRSWGQRNRLFVVRGQVGMITLPVSHEDDQEATFLDISEAETTVWRRKFLNLLNQNYRGAPQGEAVLTLVREWLAGHYRNLAELEIAFIEKIAAYLDLRAHFRRSSTLGTAGLRRSRRLQAILERLGAGTYVSAHGSFPYMKADGVFPLANLPTYFQNHVPREYPQRGADVFVPRLSCLDALANLPTEQVRIKLRGTEWWQNWAEREAAESNTPVHS